MSDASHPTPSPGRPDCEGPILLFDGICNLCNGAVAFVVRRDPRGTIRFAALQSEAGMRLLRAHHLPVEGIESLVLIDAGRAWMFSDAALRTAGYLRRPWAWACHFRFVPRPLRDAIYRWVARNRYRWFGRRAECMVPDASLRARFLS